MAPTSSAGLNRLASALERLNTTASSADSRVTIANRPSGDASDRDGRAAAAELGRPGAADDADTADDADDAEPVQPVQTSNPAVTQAAAAAAGRILPCGPPTLPPGGIPGEGRTATIGSSVRTATVALPPGPRVGSAYVRLGRPLKGGFRQCYGHVTTPPERRPRAGQARQTR